MKTHPNTSVHTDGPKANRRLTMKYTKEERLDIGRRIYDGEITRYQAAEEYGVGEQTARSYMRLYRDANQLPPKHNTRNFHIALSSSSKPSGIKEFEAMTKEELIQELVKARITETRLKKGYMVKGDGPDKEYILLDSKNTK